MNHHLSRTALGELLGSRDSYELVLLLILQRDDGEVGLADDAAGGFREDGRCCDPNAVERCTGTEEGTKE